MTIKIAVLTFVLTCTSATFAQSSACAKTDYDCRIKELRQQIAANPKDSELYYNLALALQNKEQYADSVPVLSTYLSSGVTKPEYLADGFSLRGYANRQLGNYDRAVADYTTAISYVSNKADHYLNRGRSYNSLRKFDLAIADMTKAISLDGTNISAFFGRGYAYMELKNNPPAIADFTKVIALDPKESEAFYNRGTIYYRQQKYSLAVADLDNYIDLNTSNEKNLADGYENRGLAYFYLGNTNQAIADYTKAIEYNPVLKNAYLNRAAAYRKVGKLTLAEDDEKRAAAIQP